jgi:hypothetical protein
MTNDNFSNHLLNTFKILGTQLFPTLLQIHVNMHTVDWPGSAQLYFNPTRKEMNGNRNNLLLLFFGKGFGGCFVDQPALSLAVKIDTVHRVTSVS